MAINSQMRNYKYYLLGRNDEYGQPIPYEEEGNMIKMAINFASEAISENPLYSGAQYTGLTFDKKVDASYVIQYGNEKLKVLYAHPAGRYRQVFMARM